MAKTRLLVIAGGQSEEHQVSLSSANSVIEGLADSDISVSTTVISKDGHWLDPASSLKVLRGEPVETSERDSASSFISRCTEFDVVFPLVHGTTGEDGLLQGFLQMLGLPYIGCGVLASAVCMDKPLFKDIAKTHSLPQSKYICFEKGQFEMGAQQLFDKVQEKLSPPWIIKPASLGSSIGIVKVQEESRLEMAFAEAFKHDRRILVEEAVTNLWELEVGVLGNDAPRASVVGRTGSDTGVWDYKSKYEGSDPIMHVPADVPSHIAEVCRSTALDAYRIYGCAGFARIDFLYDYSSGKVLLNEINTLPGLTKTSMFLRLWESEGMSCGALVQELMRLSVNSTRNHDTIAS
ncbi:hypothetical protein OHC33_003032 [Knufia fluminis]|uniref:ATP-grasp domain-containing protein n=1 Tax=Knufia fluminis TaxID=191047 RepID=A0AAN8EGQ2_9EURO|nr:hypothetical protein OHC33_003032 [Knufia fluminis]